MTLIDANLLLYAYDSASPRHDAARRWLAAEFSSGRPVRLALATLLAFVRIASDRRIFTHPMAPADACELVESTDRDFTRFPGVEILNPTDATPP